ncbi:hypothetical protein KVT40_000051 [Elsinoe batatas]|uniref:Uncharacterized protein n=1 Tax=Elsinoe batatas TaxID=2601811 RepID=A0A8K0L6M8_9PEZI|nr:hypothetical protein KVT40_000051 [Elsinoe batatas]
MRFSLLALPALAISVSAAAISSDAVTTEAPAPTDGPATYANSESALSSAVSDFEKKSPAPAATTPAATSTLHVSAKPAVTGSPSPTKKAAATTKKGKKAKTTTTTTTKKKKAAATKKNGKPKTTAAANKKKTNAKRQNIADCAAMPKFYNYSPSQNYNTTKAILTNYMADSTFTAASLAGTAPTGYRWLWQGFYASAGAPYYVGAQVLPSYNVTACASICNSSPGCKSFNIYYERTPSLAPAAACPNPTAITAIKCAMWDYILTPAWATNAGQWQNDFAAVITGSNAYVKS